MTLFVSTAPASAQEFILESGEVVVAGNPVEIELVDLPPEAEVEIRAERVLKTHYLRGSPTLRYQSMARFAADENGTVDLVSNPSLGGSYEGADAAGLFWSMQPVSEESVEADDTVKLEAVIDGEVVATASFELASTPAGFELREVPGFPGSYFAPHPGPGDHPVVIVVGGDDSVANSREVVCRALSRKGIPSCTSPLTR